MGKNKGKNNVKFEFGPVAQVEMLFKDFLICLLGLPFSSAKRNHLCNFVRKHMF